MGSDFLKEPLSNCHIVFEQIYQHSMEELLLLLLVPIKCLFNNVLYVLLFREKVHSLDECDCVQVSN